MASNTGERHLLWQSLEEPGMEHLHVRSTQQHVTADGAIVGALEGQPLRVQYTVVASASYRFEQLTLSMGHPAAQVLALNHGSAGAWTDAKGQALPELDGCIDIDLQVTPFTNTLPVRRIGLAVGQSAEISVAYVAFPSLVVSAERQRYTRLEAEPGSQRYRFEHLSNGFTADVLMDEDGLIVEYPGLFQRVPMGQP